MSPTLFPPIGVDRADGSQFVNGFSIGTPSANGSIIMANSYGSTSNIGNSSGSSFVFEEDPESPEIERGEQCTCRHTFYCDFNTYWGIINGFGRGTIVMDTHNNIWKVLTCTGQPMRGSPFKYRVVLVEESVSFDTPPDKFRIEAIELNPDLTKHPRYAFLTPQEKQLAAASANSTSFATFAKMANGISTIPHTPGTFDMLDGTTFTITTSSPASAPGGSSAGENKIGTNQQHYVAAYELMTKLFCGEQTFYLPGFRIQWTQFYWLPPGTRNSDGTRTPPLHPGGVIQDPIFTGTLPYFFWNTDNPQTNNPNHSVFDAMANYNPQLYSSDGTSGGSTAISWLRLVDMPVEWERTWFAVTRTWLGAPYSHWDRYLYTNISSPYPPPPSDPLLASGPF